MEFRVERRLTAVLERLVPPNELPPALPSLEQELDALRLLEDSPARSLVKAMSRKHLGSARELDGGESRGLSSYASSYHQ